MINQDVKLLVTFALHTVLNMESVILKTKNLFFLNEFYIVLSDSFERDTKLMK